MSLDGRQKLAAYLITPLMGLAAYSFIQVLGVLQFFDQVPLKFENASSFNEDVEENLKHIEAMGEIVDGIGERVRQVKDANLERGTDFTQDEIDQLISALDELRTTLHQDRGRVSQFNSELYPLLKDSAAALTKILNSEDETWNALIEVFQNLPEVTEISADYNVLFRKWTESTLNLLEGV